MTFDDDTRWAGVLGLLLLAGLGVMAWHSEPGKQPPWLLLCVMVPLMVMLLHRRTVTVDATAGTVKVKNWRPWRRSEENYPLSDFTALVLGA